MELGSGGYDVSKVCAPNAIPGVNSVAGYPHFWSASEQTTAWALQKQFSSSRNFTGRCDMGVMLQGQSPKCGSGHASSVPRENSACAS